MHHEMDDPAALVTAQLLGGHSKETLVMGQEVACGGEKERTAPGDQKAQGQGKQQRPAIAGERLKKCSIIGGWKIHLVAQGLSE
ncbi:MAG TPA: hypothetical protein VGP68_24210 [Gemmataceae bacterium]|nr:hypothetical protein [Gemmataceae bacterium]